MKVLPACRRETGIPRLMAVKQAFTSNVYDVQDLEINDITSEFIPRRYIFVIFILFRISINLPRIQWLAVAVADDTGEEPDRRAGRLVRGPGRRESRPAGRRSPRWSSVIIQVKYICIGERVNMRLKIKYLLCMQLHLMMTADR